MYSAGDRSAPGPAGSAARRLPNDAVTLGHRRTPGTSRRGDVFDEVGASVGRARTAGRLGREDGRHAGRRKRGGVRARDWPMVGHDVELRLAIPREDDSGRTVEAATQPLARHRGDEQKQVDDEAERGAHAGEGRQATAAREGAAHAPRVAIRARVDNRTNPRGPAEGLAGPGPEPHDTFGPARPLRRPARPAHRPVRRREAPWTSRSCEAGFTGCVTASSRAGSSRAR